MLLFLELSSLHADIKGKDILSLSEGPAQGLDDTTLTAEGIYPLNFTHPNKRFVLSLHNNDRKRFFIC